MESRIFYSTKCYNLIEDSSGTIYPKTIYLGCSHHKNRKLYLYFEIDSIPSQAMVESACLVFYEKNTGVHSSSEIYPLSITPAGEYINPYFYEYQKIKEIVSYRQQFKEASSKHIVTADVTYLVQNWVTRQLPNYGCFVELTGYRELRAFAGVQLKGVEPFLKVNYKMPAGKLLSCYMDEIELSSTAVMNPNM